MNIIPKMESSWNNVLKNEFQKDYFKEIEQKISNDIKK
jgi:uracil DNA glycosylase